MAYYNEIPLETLDSQPPDTESTSLRGRANAAEPTTPLVERTIKGTFEPILWMKDRVARFKFKAEGKGRYTKGWRTGAIAGGLACLAVFMINLIVTIVFGVKASSGVLFEGNCEKARQLNSEIHLVINGLGAILLSASNYTMQCLSAPTRSEIDVAHAKGVWLDIGILSFRNLRHINPRRVLLWCLLGITTLPLQLFYNSAVYMSIRVNEYEIFAVSTLFLNSSTEIALSNDTRYSTLLHLHNMAQTGSLDNLTNLECINEYARQIQSNRKSLLLVASDDKFNKSYWDAYFSREAAPYVYDEDVSTSSDSLSSSHLYSDVYEWICWGGWFDYEPIQTENGEKYPGCTNLLDEARAYAKNWTAPPMLEPIDYCLSDGSEANCKVQWNVPIAIIVIISNLCKAIVVLYFAIFCNADEPLLTIGDGITSFLQDEDSTTSGIRLLPLKDNDNNELYLPRGPQPHSSTIYRWKDVTSRIRRFITCTLFITACISMFFLLNMGFKSIRDIQSMSLSEILRMGFGSLDARALITFDVKGVMGNIVVANSPQPILSFLYFMYNGLFTAMLLGREWASYSDKRKGLRVSSAPSGEQRSTYFLQLPYRFSIPLMILNALLHWLVSQSLFFVSIESYDIDNHLHSSALTCGFSPIAIVTTIAVTIFMIWGLLAFGYVPLKSDMPLAGSCSAAISAECHLIGVDRYGAATKKVQWGVINVEDGLCHTAFSSGEVRPVEEGDILTGSKMSRSRHDEFSWGYKLSLDSLNWMRRRIGRDK
ncbi:hypothetical protein BS50DRAFT_617555 [Corynespora cassiicola Philippines]|uniref:DUF6536 domain-containing protein n=1 Tax=Corynespora cassiicola Philippines TaxID=1448308 RepID=A0A2T2P4N7_CORCC|nr:hypothetical protein BS50DRAFT_617555 [Corynespora cassiicola Philippines]